MKNVKAKDGKMVYEVGFHFIPTIPSENIAGEFVGAKDFIEKKGGIFISEEMPKLRSLAYPMVKKIGNLNVTFETAYFGWVKFEIESGLVSDINNFFDTNKNVLRFITIKTAKENTMAPQKILSTKENGVKTKKTETKSSVSSTESKSISEAEIDKTIEELVA